MCELKVLPGNADRPEWTLIIEGHRGVGTPSFLGSPYEVGDEVALVQVMGDLGWAIVGLKRSESEVFLSMYEHNGKGYVKRPSRYLSHQERLHLAVVVHGLYTFPLADKIDAQCAMDNWGIPFIESQLKERDRACLNSLKDSHVQHA